MILLGIIMSSQVIAAVLGAPALFPSASNGNEVITYDYPFVSRSQWNARPPKQQLPLAVPVPFLVIHHSYTPPACYTTTECCKSMRSMQNYHMDDRNWWDIGYHFAVGGDGSAYEGRGWGVLGAHALHFNNVSIGICLIGDWTNSLPPTEQLKTTQALIKTAVELGYLASDYKLVGHRQVRATECPGNALFEEIKKWDHYSNYPNSVDDLPNIIGLSGSG